MRERAKHKRTREMRRTRSPRVACPPTLSRHDNSQSILFLFLSNDLVSLFNSCTLPPLDTSGLKKRKFFLCCVLVASKFGKNLRAGEIHESHENWRTCDTREAPKVNAVLSENLLKLTNFVFPICCSDLHACNEFASLRLWNASCNVSVSNRTTDFFFLSLTFFKLEFLRAQPSSQGLSAGEEMSVSSRPEKPWERGCDLPETLGRSVGNR